MTYQELIDQVRKGRSVHATAKALGIPSTTFQRYASGTRFPPVAIAQRLAEAAGADPAEVFEAIADAQRKYKKDL